MLCMPVWLKMGQYARLEDFERHADACNSLEILENAPSDRRPGQGTGLVSAQPADKANLRNCADTSHCKPHVAS